MAVLEKPAFSIRDAVPADLDEIIRIENEAFLKPWEAGSLATEIIRPMCLFRVAFVNGMDTDRIAGYIVIWLVADEAHILKIAVDEHLRRQGLATLLLEDALHDLTLKGARITYLEVRTSNLDAQAFYEKHHFDQIGVRPGYYSDTSEDAKVYFKGLP